MNIPTQNTKYQKGFSMVEVMITVAVLSILALIAVATITKVNPAAELSKLRADVQILNTAIKIYKHSGGDLSTADTAAEVIGKLKTIRQKSTSKSFVGYTGSMIDPRLMINQVDASSAGPRAIYNKAKNRFFVTTDSVPGFRLDLDFSKEPGHYQIEETRAESVLEYSEESSWVWDYEDAPPPAHLDPTPVTKVNISNPTPGGPGVVGSPTGPPAPVLEKLLPPEFSLPSDYYELENFPLAVTLQNPNNGTISKIVYGIINAANWQWLDYTGPVTVGPGDKVLAFVESLKPREFHHSDPADEQYNWTATLQNPGITVSDDEIDARTGSTTVTITHSNNSDYFEYGGNQLPIPGGAFVVQYKLIPLESGQGTATGWEEYTSPFDVGGPQFPKGFEVVSRVKSSSPHFFDSGEASLSVSSYYELDPPAITSSVETLTNPDETALITLTNTNPTGSSELVYQILDDDGNPATGWMNYTSPFPVSGSQYPKGFTIAAKSMPLETYYRESPAAFKAIAVQFFGIEVTGKTIFILDSSGSMTTNDRMGRLKAAATAVLGSLDSDDSFALIDYDSSATTLIPWGAATNDRKNQAQIAINGMVAGGGTNYHQAMATGVGLNTLEADQVIFLSDGLPNPKPADNEEILVFVDQLLGQGVTRFDTVALGITREILEQMADRGNGTQVVVPD